MIKHRRGQGEAIFLLLVGALVVVALVFAFSGQRAPLAKTNATSNQSPPSPAPAIAPILVPTATPTPVPNGMFKTATQTSLKPCAAGQNSNCLSAKQFEFLSKKYAFIVGQGWGKETIDNARKINPGAKILLYKSIRAIWPTQTGYVEYAWANENENMFEHNANPAANPNCASNNCRIQTVFGSWLANASDVANESDPNALKHWVNYFAAKVSEEILNEGFDGLFADSAVLKLFPNQLVGGVMPGGYSDEKYRASRIASVNFVGKKLPAGKIFIANSLVSSQDRYSGVDVLEYADGALMELFLYLPDQGYTGEIFWQGGINNALAAASTGKLVSLGAKKKGLAVKDRLFITASYLLVHGEKTHLSLWDWPEIGAPKLQYFPEYDVDLGAPLQNGTNYSSFLAPCGAYERNFSKGKAMVNPSTAYGRACTLDADYFELVPSGGGEVGENGEFNGSIAYQKLYAGDKITIPAASGMLLLKR